MVMKAEAVFFHEPLVEYRFKRVERRYSLD